MPVASIVLIYLVVSGALYGGVRYLQARADRLWKPLEAKRVIPRQLWTAICILGVPWLLVDLVISTTRITAQVKRERAAKAPSPAREPAKPQVAASACSYLFDAGSYGGVQYWCNNTTSPGLLGQGTRIPLTDVTHLARYCRGNFKACPLNSMMR